MEHYFVKLPPALKQVFTMGTLFGCVFAAGFGAMRFLHVSGASMGHVILGLVLALVCASVLLYTVRWEVEVTPGRLLIHSLLKPQKEVAVGDITKMVIGSRREKILYTGDKKIITISAGSVNADKLYADLIRAGVKKC